jgi:hypothetical protein
MKLYRLAEYFKNQELSDCDLVIKVGAASGHKPDPERKKAGQEKCCSKADEIVAQFPAHRVFLFAADYFKAQVRVAHSKAVLPSVLAIYSVSCICASHFRGS